MAYYRLKLTFKSVHFFRTSPSVLAVAPAALTALVTSCHSEVFLLLVRPGLWLIR